MNLTVRHGHSRRTGHSSTYRIWAAMLTRCRNPNQADWHRYGGRGIRVCERWLTFENFLADMGERPDAMTLDRYPNNDGHYEPGNCRWASRAEQTRNTCRTRLIEFDGRRMCINDWARALGMPIKLLQSRFRKRWPITRALTEPGGTYHRERGKQQRSTTISPENP